MHVPVRAPPPDQHNWSDGGASPHGYSRPSVPAAARCHSASVGRRAPRDAQNATAWFQSTQLIGWSPRPATPQLQAPPVFGAVHPEHVPYAATVTSVRSRQNGAAPGIATIPAGHPSGRTQASPSARNPLGHCAGAPVHALRLGSQVCPGQQQWPSVSTFCT